MHLFGRNEGVSSQEIDELQAADDQVTAARDFINETWNDLAYEGVHPWHTDNLKLLQLAWASHAYAYDRTAEMLRDEGVISHDRPNELTSDTAYFSVGLTQTAASLIDSINQVMPTQDTAEFNEQTRVDLYAANIVCMWPRVSKETITADWQDPDSPVVTTNFIRGILHAAQDIHAEASSNMTSMFNTQQTNATVPEEYGAMGDVLNDIMHSASLKLTAAENLIQAAANSTLSEADKTQMYAQAHDGYIEMVTALVASVCPPTLGEEFLPNR